MSAICVKILVKIDQRNQIIQARDTTIDVEVENLDSLITEIIEFRGCWNSILEEAKLVATSMNISNSFKSSRSRKRKRKRFFDDSPELIQQEPNDDDRETEFKQRVFFGNIDSVVDGFIGRFKSAQDINKMFSFLWKYIVLSKDELVTLVGNFATKYAYLCYDQLKEEMLHLKVIHSANLGSGDIRPLELRNKIVDMKLEEIFPNVCISLRIFCTLPVTIATGERSFSKLKHIRNVLRNTMRQDRLNDLAILSIEYDLARKVDFNTVIDNFCDTKSS